MLDTHDTSGRQLTCTEMVPNTRLRAFAKLAPPQGGSNNPRVVNQMWNALPHICGELLALRAVAQAEGKRLPFPQPRNHDEEIANARAQEGSLEMVVGLCQHLIDEAAELKATLSECTDVLKKQSDAIEGMTPKPVPVEVVRSAHHG